MRGLLPVVVMIFSCGNIYSQIWQPFGIPLGGGVTDMAYWEGAGPNFLDKLWVATNSDNWPNGQLGGVFWADAEPAGQVIWNQVAYAYIARTLEIGQDGELYASIWYDPTFTPADALYRFEPRVGIFGFLYQAQAGDNIFSIAVKNNPHTIFAGTRNGVIRSTNDGLNFDYANTGIPDSTWVYDIAIDSGGILAIATSKGVFISEDNGENWLITSGISVEDTVTTLLFSNNPFAAFQKRTISVQDDEWLYTGTHNGKLLRSVFENGYLTFALVWLFADNGDEELSDAVRLARQVIIGINKRSKKDTGITKTTETSGIYESTDEGLTWNQINNGLPPEPPISGLAAKGINETSYELFAGLFNDTINGAAVYKLSITTGTKDLYNRIPFEYKLEQNYPNPFNPTTNFEFRIANFGLVVLKVFDVLGKEVATILNEELPSGNYSRQWNAEGLSGGIYFYRLSTENFTETKKLILMK